MSDMNDVLFVGGYYHPSTISFLLENTKTGLDFAASNLQEAIIKGLKDNRVNYTVVSAPYIGSFPFRFRTPFIKGFKSEDGDFVSVPYLNVTGLKWHNIRRKVYKEINRWCLNHNGTGIILFYNFSCLPLVNRINREYPRVKIVLVVTDLREYMSVDKSLHNRVFDMFLKDEADKSYYKSIDAFILLAEKMREKIPVLNKPWLLMEGIYNPEDTETCGVISKQPKSILYTGNLGRRYGILDLLAAFSLIDDSEYQLWFRGSGDCEQDIRNAMKNDARILFFDRMSRDKLLMLQKQATVLVNPVRASQRFTGYFFPSKTLEYLASGTPTIMHRLSCMPDEYSTHYYSFESETPKGMAETIMKICSKPQDELNEFGDRARKFIFGEKTPEVQIKRMIDFFHANMIK